MKRTMKALRDMRYGTRRLKAGDTFEATHGHAKLLDAMKRAEYVDEGRPRRQIPPIPEALKTRALVAGGRSPADSGAPVDDIGALRSEYETKIGRKPYMGWKADELRKRIAEAAA